MCHSNTNVNSSCHLWHIYPTFTYYFSVDYLSIYIYIYMYVYFILEMHKTDCIDIELCDKCFSLSCECIIVNIDLRMISGEHRGTNWCMSNL